MLDTHSDTTATASQTAAICESLALYGASPERGEFDSREVWNEDDAIDTLGEALLWSLVNCFHAQIARLDGMVDRITREMQNLERAGRHRGECVGVGDPHRPRASMATGAMRSRSCAIPSPRPTASTPATSGARATDRTPARPER